MADGTYTVQPGDTLSAIAQRNGTTVAKLAQLNGISDPDRLSVGEKLKLSEPPTQSSDQPLVCSVQPLFLDPMRHPIEGLHHRVQCSSTTVTGTSATNGLGKAVNAQPGDHASIWAKIPWQNNAWVQLAEVALEEGEKLVTLISPMARIKAPLDPHPTDKFSQPKQEEAPAKTATQHPRGTPSSGKGKLQSEVAKGSGKGLHSRKEKDKHGITRVVLTQDLPDLKDCFAAYTGEKITEADWQNAAGQIGCEIAVIQAFAEVESSGGGFIPHSGTPPLPKILYERTYFSSLTGGQYDATNADLSMPSAEYMKHLKKEIKRDEKRKHDQAQVTALKALYQAKDNIRRQDAARHLGHLLGIANYHRFINAALLNENAAIESCSWGMFQIMGKNWQICGATNQHAFLKTAFTSERAQLTKLFVPFVQHDDGGKLKKALIAKDWVQAARIYNGPDEAVTPKSWTAAQKKKQHKAYVEHLVRADRHAHKKPPSSKELAKLVVPDSWKKAHPLAPWLPYHTKLKDAYERIKGTGQARGA